MNVLQGVIALKQAAPLRDIAKRVSMGPSQTHRYLSSLVTCGMLQQDSATGFYDLGPAALRTGLAALARHYPLNRADEAARELSRRTSATTMLTVWSPNGPIIVRWYHGRPPIYTLLTVGSIVGLTNFSAGHVFMAFLPDQLLEPILVAEGYQVPVNRNPELRTIRDRVRATYLASIDSTNVPGLRTHAAPVFGGDHELVCALTIATADNIATSVDDANTAALFSASRELTLSLGGTWNDTAPARGEPHSRTQADGPKNPAGRRPKVRP
jgi:DNA-binding IclR family transcriptional regulator